MKNKVKYLSGLIAVVLFMLALTACNSDKDTGDTSSNSEVKEVVAENVSSVEVSSEVSSEPVLAKPASSEQTSSEAVSSKETPSQAVSSDKQPVSSKTQSSVQDKPKATSSKPANSKSTSSKPTQWPASSESPNFGERMDEAEVDRIIAEGIEYAESKGMTWKDDYTIEGSGYYNPAFSGAGAEIFKRDLFYHIDQLYDMPDDYYVEGDPIYYKIVKGEFEEPGYWYGFVLY